MPDPRLPEQGPDFGGIPDAGRTDKVRADRAADLPPLADREVPLPGTEAFPAVPTAVHAWLDGEGTAHDARLADPKQVALWERIGEETTRRARMTTPAHVPRAIMDALPAVPPSAAKAMPAVAPAADVDGRLSLTPATAAFAAAVLVAVGFLLGRVLG
jgi:hypothetical protein